MNNTNYIEEINQYKQIIFNLMSENQQIRRELEKARKEAEKLKKIERLLQLVK